MIIRKNRIRSESYLNEFKKGSNLTIKVNNVLNSQTKIEKFGFKLDDVDGTRKIYTNNLLDKNRVGG